MCFSLELPVERQELGISGKLFFFYCNMTSTKLNVVLGGQSFHFGLYSTLPFSQLMLLHPYFLARRYTFPRGGMEGGKEISASS